MLGMMQIMIWLLCVYLVFKGIEIFQIAFVSSRDGLSRGTGITVGIIMIIVAVAAAIIFFMMEEQMAKQVGDSQQNLPNLNFNR